MENPEGWGVYNLLQKTENPGRRGVLSEIPSMVGVWIFSGTTHFHLYQKNKLNIIVGLLYLVLNMLAISSELLNRLVFHVKCMKFPCRFVGTFHAFYIKYILYFQQSQAMSMLSPFPPQPLQPGEYYAVDYVQSYYFGSVLDTSDGFV